MKKVSAAALVMIGLYAYGTHLKGGYITVERIDCSLQHKITLNIFVNTDPADNPVHAGHGTLRFGDGQKHTTPQLNSVPLPDVQNVGLVQYSVVYEYPALGTYLVSYEEANRSPRILNIPNSHNLLFSIKTLIQIDPFIGCINSSPQFIASPIFNAVNGTNINISFTARSDDDIVLDYSLVAPSADFLGNVPEYIWPKNASIDPSNGLFSWNTAHNLPIPAGDYVFTIRAQMWKSVNDVLLLVGYADFDIMITIEIVTGVTNEPTIQVYPNPTSDWIFIRLPTNSNSKIHLTNINGEVLHVEENSDKLNLTELPPGLYILKIETSQKRGTLKVIKR